MRIIRILAAATVAFMIVSAASAETINTIEQIEETALLGNLEYKTAVLEVMKAEHDLESLLKLDTSSVSLSASYPRESGSGAAWKTSATLPVFDQVSLAAAVNQDLEGTFGFSLTPLAHSSSAALSRQAYNTKIAAAEEKAVKVADTAVERYLDWTIASADYEVKKAVSDIRKLLYEEERIRFEQGESDLDEVREAFTAWSDARTALNLAFTSLQETETDLYTILNIDPSDVSVAPPASSDLSRLIENLASGIDETSLSITGSYAVLSAENTVSGLELELESIWLFEPELKIDGSITTSPEEPSPSFSATASLDIGLESWKAEDRKELEIELDISRQEAVQVIRAETLKLEQARTVVETSEINCRVAEVECEQAKELLDEARFLFELGDYSATELEEAVLLYEQSNNSLFSAEAELYMALRALSAYRD